MRLTKNSKYYEDLLMTNQKLIRDQFGSPNPAIDKIKKGLENTQTFFLLKDDRVCAVANLDVNTQDSDKVLLYFIGSKFKREGYGTKLLKEIERFAKKNNRKYILVNFAVEDLRVVQFYIKNGFELRNIRKVNDFYIYDAYKRIAV